jgi:FAD/FMN-containing dehydrogenase
LGLTRTPFAVKGGGHAFNPGFSSTCGVEISMTRFNRIQVNNAAGTVDVGAGITWGELCNAIVPLGVNVIGSREPSVGISGLILGGGEQ